MLCVNKHNNEQNARTCWSCGTNEFEQRAPKKPWITTPAHASDRRQSFFSLDGGGGLGKKWWLLFPFFSLPILLSVIFGFPFVWDWNNKPAYLRQGFHVEGVAVIICEAFLSVLVICAFVGTSFIWRKIPQLLGHEVAGKFWWTIFWLCIPIELFSILFEINAGWSGESGFGKFISGSSSVFLGLGFLYFLSVIWYELGKKIEQ